MNVARFDTLEEMLASVLSSGRGIIGRRNEAENNRGLEACIEDAGRRLAGEGGTAYIGFTHKGTPFEGGMDDWHRLADMTECVFQVYAEHGSGTYRAILMR